MASPTDGDQAGTIAFLSDGRSYGLPGDAVKRITTHASHIFLAGDRVFKLKRAVTFSYLDYSTVAARARACRAEFELNRRTAPKLYVGVRAITQTKNGVAFDGDGTVVDWVVEMVRFDQGNLFDNLAKNGKLTAPLARDLADEIATFHAEAEITPTFGGSPEIGDVIADNAKHLAAACPPLDAGTVAAATAETEAAFQRIAPLLDRRRAEGKIRRCHGDLHLRNICLFDGRPTLFDCIDFSDRIACVDVLFDLAFLLMDIEHHGLRGLGNVVFNRYFDRAPEIDGLLALPVFQSIRAAVRAKVAMDAQPRAESAERDAAAYIGLMRKVLERSEPRLIAVGGLSGTGKSTLAAALAPNFAPAPGARVIRSDVLRKRLFGVAPETRLPPNAYDPATTAKVYDALGEEAASVLAAGYTAIVDAVALVPGERHAIEQVAARANVPFIGIWLTAPQTILVSRVNLRRGDASDADTAVLERQLDIDPGTLSWRRLDASKETSALAEDVLSSL